MKVAKEQRQAALIHEDRLVRDEILRISHKVGDTGLDVTRLCQAGVDKYGIFKSYSYLHQLKSFSLDQETATWVLGKIQNDERGAFARNWKAHFSSWLQEQAPLSFLEEHRAAIIKSSYNAGPSSLEEIGQNLDESRAIRALAPEEAFEQLQEHCSKSVKDAEFGWENWPRAKALISQLAGADSGICETILTFLETTPFENEKPRETDTFYEIYLDAAGTLKLEKAVPHLLKAMLLDWESINEDIPDALANIGTPSTITQVAEFYQEHIKTVGEDDYNYLSNYLSSVFEQIDHDLAGEKASVLLQLDPQPFSQITLARAVAGRLDSELIPEALAFREKYHSSSETKALIPSLYTYAVLTGDKPDEFPQWRGALLQRLKRTEQISTRSIIPDFLSGGNELNFGSTPAKPKPPKEPAPERKLWVKPETETGRNDPCHCGSGKKFKKCCMS